MGNDTSEAAVRQLLGSWVFEITDVEIRDLPDDTPLADIEIESLDLVEVGMMAEDEWDTRIPAEAFEDVQTLGDMVRAIRLSLDADGAD